MGHNQTQVFTYYLWLLSCYNISQNIVTKTVQPTSYIQSLALQRKGLLTSALEHLGNGHVAL